MVDLVKRRFFKQCLSRLSVCGVAAVGANVLLAGCSKEKEFGLLAADNNGVRLPAGFSSRIIANSGQAVINGQEFTWHAAPDGGACFAIDSGSYSGGWIYVSNSEMQSTGGAGAIVFNAGGEVVDAYAILENTSRNCAGGSGCSKPRAEISGELKISSTHTSLFRGTGFERDRQTESLHFLSPQCDV